MGQDPRLEGASLPVVRALPKPQLGKSESAHPRCPRLLGAGNRADRIACSVVELQKQKQEAEQECWR